MPQIAFLLHRCVWSPSQAGQHVLSTQRACPSRSILYPLQPPLALHRALMAAIRLTWRIDLGTKHLGYGSLPEAPKLHLPCSTRHAHSCTVLLVACARHTVWSDTPPVPAPFDDVDLYSTVSIAPRLPPAPDFRRRRSVPLIRLKYASNSNSVLPLTIGPAFPSP